MDTRRFSLMSLFKIVALTVITALVIAACGGDEDEPAATPTTAPRPTATSAPAPTAAPTVAPTATSVPATPTPQPPVFGAFRVDPGKIAGIEYPSSKPNFSLAPRKGGVFKHANALVWPHFDVTEVGASATVTATAPVYSKLVVCKGTLEMAAPNAFSCEVGPQLAQSWTVSGDGKTYTFRLRQGVKWHNVAPLNGREFTSADIV
jgi:ABC-type transport system substrate-binding protein